MKKFIKDTMVSIRINGEIKDWLAKAGISPQDIINAYIDEIFEVKIEEVKNENKS